MVRKGHRFLFSWRLRPEPRCDHFAQRALRSSLPQPDEPESDNDGMASHDLN